MQKNVPCAYCKWLDKALEFSDVDKIADVSPDMPSTTAPASLNTLYSSRNLQASFVHPGVDACEQIAMSFDS